MISADLRTHAISTLCFLFADIFQLANSGHSELAMGVKIVMTLLGLALIRLGVCLWLGFQV